MTLSRLHTAYFFGGGSEKSKNRKKSLTSHLISDIMFRRNKKERLFLPVWRNRQTPWT